MKTKAGFLPAAGATVAVVLALGAQPALAQENTEQTRERTETQAQKREQIYASQQMSAQERAAYRTRMRNAKSEGAREQIRAEHRKTMQRRAEQRNKSAADAPRNGKAQESRFEKRKSLGSRPSSRQGQGRQSGGGRRGH